MSDIRWWLDMSLTRVHTCRRRFTLSIWRWLLSRWLTGAFNVIRRTDPRLRAGARAYHISKGQKFEITESVPPSFLGVSVKRPGANRSDRVECTKLPEREQYSFDLDAVSFSRRTERNKAERPMMSKFSILRSTPPLDLEFAFRGENHSSTFHVDLACLSSLTSRFRMRFLRSNAVRGNDGWKIARDICDNIILCSFMVTSLFRRMSFEEKLWEN